LPLARLYSQQEREENYVRIYANTIALPPVPSEENGLLVPNVGGVIQFPQSKRGIVVEGVSPVLVEASVVPCG